MLILGTTISKKADNLIMGETYNYRVDVADRKATKTETGSVVAYCSGKGLNCAGGTKCSLCNGTGTHTVSFSQLTEFDRKTNDATKYRCQKCGTISTHIAFWYWCYVCGSSTPQMRYQYAGCGHYNWDDPNTHSCNHNGGKIGTGCAAHNIIEAHEYCIHNETTKHD